MSYYPRRNYRRYPARRTGGSYGRTYRRRTTYGRASPNVLAAASWQLAKKQERAEQADHLRTQLNMLTTSVRAQRIDYLQWKLARNEITAAEREELDVLHQYMMRDMPQEEQPEVLQE